MHCYRERLSVTPLWWVSAMLIMLTFGAIVWTGFDPAVTAATFGGLIVITAACLLNWSRATIEVAGGELRAGGESLPLAHVGDVRPLDEAQTRALRGPRADPRAFVLIRPYLRCAVYIEVTRPGARPYWLLATRRPAELAAAIERSRPVVSADGAVVT